MTQDEHEHMHPSGGPWRNFYGRFRGKTLRPQQKTDLEELLPRYRLNAVIAEEKQERTPLDLKRLFEDRMIWLEIGFGGGEHLHALAKAHPEVCFIGCEPFVNGVAMLLGKLRAEPLDNLWVFDGDARHLFDVLPAASVERAYLLYPDPWPKKRHHRRRFVTEEHLGPLARVLSPGGVFKIATDIEDYARQSLQIVPQFGFDWTAEHADNWRRPWQGWVTTRYEQKAIHAARAPTYLEFERS